MVCVEQLQYRYRSFVEPQGSYTLVRCSVYRVIERLVNKLGLLLGSYVTGDCLLLGLDQQC